MSYPREVVNSVGPGRLLLNRRFRHTARWFILPIVVIVLAAVIFPVVLHMAEFIGAICVVLFLVYRLIDGFVEIPHPNFNRPKGPLVIPPPHADYAAEYAPVSQPGPSRYGDPYWAPPVQPNR